jgi:hypothetical protein
MTDEYKFGDKFINIEIKMGITEEVFEIVNL